MGAAEHRHVGQPVRQRGHPLGDGIERGQQHVGARRLQHQRMARVVDVLAGAREVHEFGRPREFGIALQAPLEPVLDRLDVVVGGPLDVLDRLGVRSGEARDPRAQACTRGRRQREELGESCVGQRDEPLDLDLHAPLHQPEFGQQGAQRRQFGGVASVQRRQVGERRVRHPGGS
jgi:hypothetical protein